MATLALPSRPWAAATGSELSEDFARLTTAERDARVREELLVGNVPDWLRRMTAVTVTARAPGGAEHTLSYDVTPDYLALGSSTDFVRMPMTPLTGQVVADAAHAMMPTTKMVDDIHRAAPLKVTPCPFSPAAHKTDSMKVFLLSNQAIDKELAELNAERGACVGGDKKDIVITKFLATNPGRVAIYGWHEKTGRATQKLYWGHGDYYVDYSHGVRLVARDATLDGAPHDLLAVLADPTLAFLVSHEGAVQNPRYR